jgi:hypothetical protein
LRLYGVVGRLDQSTPRGRAARRCLWLLPARSMGRSLRRRQ